VGAKRPPLPFKEIASAASERCKDVVGHWLPGGKEERGEWVAINPTRNDKSVGSFSVRLSDGVWSDFATNDNGDLIKLVQYVDGLQPY
jgi:putative DNA primase/helicase